MSDPTTLADIAELEDVASRGPSARVILLSLLGASIGVAALVLGAGLAFGAISHTEAGFCGRVSTPCTSLPLSSVEKYANVDLPAGTEVSEAYYLDWTSNSMLRDGVPADAGFRAQVRLPAGAADVLAGTDYVPGESMAQTPSPFDPAFAATLSDVRRFEATDDDGPTDPSYRYAVSAIDADGRRVYAFGAVPGQ